MYYVPGEVKEMPAPTSKRPEEREFVLDSGASMHMMSKKELSSEEMGTVKRSRTPTVVLTANGEVHTHEEAKVFVRDLNQFVTVQLLEETPAVLSHGKLCKDHGYSNEWVSGQEPRLTKEGKSSVCSLLILEAVRPLHRYHRNVQNRSMLRAHLHVQYLREVTNKPPGDWGRNLWKSKTKLKRGMTRRMRTIRWHIFRSGERISQIIWSPPKCMHPHTVLRTQTRNIL